jgi:hypothetical protein
MMKLSHLVNGAIVSPDAAPVVSGTAAVPADPHAQDPANQQDVSPFLDRPFTEFVFAVWWWWWWW